MNDMPISTNEYNARARGGTELSMAELEARLDPALLEKVWIVPSRLREIPDGLVPIYWVHDTEDDPEVQHLANGGWNKFAVIVFVSNWQMQRFIQRFSIPWSKCRVLPNAVNPFPAVTDWDEDAVRNEFRFIYHTTPHRGLDVLYVAFQNAYAVDPTFRLDVYSSFDIYGWEGADKKYAPLFEAIRSHPGCTYHGAKPNEVVREALTRANAFVYPCIWPETGCRALIEAKMAGIMTACTDYGCLTETASHDTYVYHYVEDKNKLAEVTAVTMLDMASTVRDKFDTNRLMRFSGQSLANLRFSWDGRAREWNDLLMEVLQK